MGRNADPQVDLSEIGRHMAAQMDKKVGHPLNYAIQVLGGNYIEDHREDFDIKSNGQIVFIGGDSTKMGVPDNYEEDDNEDEDEDKITFSMSEGFQGDDE